MSKTAAQKGLTERERRARDSQGAKTEPRLARAILEPMIREAFENDRRRIDSTLPYSERERRRQEIDETERRRLERLYDEYPITEPVTNPPRKPGPKPSPNITAAVDEARAAIAQGVPEKRATMDAAQAHGVGYDSVRTRLRRSGQLVNSN